MSGAGPANVQTPFFSADASPEGNELRARMRGVADLRAQPLLAGFLSGLHRGATAMRVERVRIDVSALEFMNASCLEELVRWIESVLGASNRYPISFVSNPAQRWQARSLQALTCLAPELITVDS